MEVCNNVIVQHHERLDGSGYPFKLTDKYISFEAKVIAVADVVDALLSWRPYKKPFSWEKLVDVINNDKGLEKKFVYAIINNKDKVLEVSNINNNLLKDMLNLSESEIDRQ